MSAHAPRAITRVVAIAWRAAIRQKQPSSKAAAARLVITPAALIVCAIDDRDVAATGRLPRD